MKKLLLLLALISSISFGIDKKTPTGGTVKDKPGKNQESIGDYVESAVFVGAQPLTGGGVWTAGPSIKLGSGLWFINGSAMISSASAAVEIALRFYDGTNSFGYGAAGYITNAVISFPSITSVGIIRITSGVKTIQLYGHASANNTYYLGSGSINGGRIVAIKIGN